MLLDKTVALIKTISKILLNEWRKKHFVESILQLSNVLKYN